MTPQRIQIQDVQPQVDGGRFPVKACLGDEVWVGATIFRDGHAQDLWRRPIPARRDTPVARGDARGNGQRSLRGRRSTRRPRAVGVPDPGLGRPVRHVARRARPQGRGRPGRSRRRAVRRARALRRGHGGRWRGGCRGAFLPRAPRYGEELRFSASTSIASEPGSARGTSSSHDPGAAFAALRPCCRSSPPLASTSSTCLPSTRSARPIARAATTPSALARATSVARGRSAELRAATMRCTPTSGAMPTSTRWCVAARDAGLELALDFAIQCSPDHPWLVEHPEWFHRRPDGSLKYAENPPKRYQDIHNVDWETAERAGLWNALRDVVLGWCARGSSCSGSTTRTRSRCRSGSG